MATAKFFRQVELPHQKRQEHGLLFPTVLSPNPSRDSTALQLCDLEEAIKGDKSWLESLLRETGAILFRGFPLTSPSDFNHLVEAFGFPEMLYDTGGQASRIKVVGRVYTANECPSHLRIPFHHEMAYAPDFPTKLFFFCEEEPGKGGETPIILSHNVYEKMKAMHPNFVALLEEHGLMYIKMASDVDDPSSITGNGWKSTYKTHDKKIAEQRAAKLGRKLEWIGNSVKITTGPVPAIRYDQESQRKTWFNSLVVSYPDPATGKAQDENISVVLGNGEPLPDDVVEDYMNILEEESVAIPWKKGDVLLINNLMVLHGRQPLLKPPRRILASLCK